MTATQLELLPAEPVAPTLTPRQKLALAHIAQHQPVPSEALGAVLHADRLMRTARGHTADRECAYCKSEGAQMGASLRNKSLVRYLRGEGWTLVDYKPGRVESGYDPATADIPF